MKWPWIEIGERERRGIGVIETEADRLLREATERVLGSVADTVARQEAYEQSLPFINALVMADDEYRKCLVASWPRKPLRPARYWTVGG